MVVVLLMDPTVLVSARPDDQESLSFGSLYVNGEGSMSDDDHVGSASVPLRLGLLARFLLACKNRTMSSGASRISHSHSGTSHLLPFEGAMAETPAVPVLQMDLMSSGTSLLLSRYSGGTVSRLNWRAPSTRPSSSHRGDRRKSR